FATETFVPQLPPLWQTAGWTTTCPVLEEPPPVVAETVTVTGPVKAEATGAVYRPVLALILPGPLATCQVTGGVPAGTENCAVSSGPIGLRPGEFTVTAGMPSCVMGNDADPPLHVTEIFPDLAVPVFASIVYGICWLSV